MTPKQTIHRLCRAMATLLALICGPVHAATLPGNLCDEAAQYAAKTVGVPYSVLKAITLTETGRTSGGAFNPWPWTINVQGRGFWFDNYETALKQTLLHHERGVRSYDVGCFQLNYKWHGQHFKSIEEMFQPRANALYAARFLADLFREKGNWEDAAGAYHSRNPVFAKKYRERFARIHARISDQPAPPPLADPAPVVARNRFPLLQATHGGAVALGSLVPLAASPRSPVIAGFAPEAPE